MRKIILGIFIISFTLLFRAFGNEQLSFYYLIFLMIGAMYLEGHLGKLQEYINFNRSRVAVFLMSVLTLLFITNPNPPLILGLIIFLFLISFRIKTDTAIQYSAYIFISIPLAFAMKATPTAELLTTCLFLLLLEITVLYIINLLVNHVSSSTQLNIQ